MFEQYDIGFEVYVACSSDDCSSCDDIYSILDGYINEDIDGSTDNFYLLTSKSVTDVSDDSSSGSSILTFASVALCALFSYVLLL